VGWKLSKIVQRDMVNQYGEGTVGVEKGGKVSQSRPHLLASFT
jgi:hypothetical protein